MKLGDRVYCRINIRHNYKNLKIKPKVSELNGQLFLLKVMWQCESDDKYPDEYALSPVDHETINIWIEKYDIAWIASGDVDILGNGCHEETTTFIDNITPDIWPDKSDNHLNATTVHYRDHTIVFEGEACNFKLYYKGDIKFSYEPQKDTKTKILNRPTDKHLGGYLISPVKDGFETFVICNKNFATYNYALSEKEILEVFDKWRITDSIKDKWSSDNEQQNYMFCAE